MSNINDKVWCEGILKKLMEIEKFNSEISIFVRSFRDLNIMKTGLTVSCYCKNTSIGVELADGNNYRVYDPNKMITNSFIDPYGWTNWSESDPYSRRMIGFSSFNRLNN